jgi:hypothetical protein
MTENQRESFRIGPDSDLTAELLQAGRSMRCELENLSAGGAKITTSRSLEAGGECTLVLRLGATMVRLPMQVLDSTATSARLRATSEPGSPEYEAAMHLVREAQRRQRAKAAGTDEASPMVSDEERRAKLRRPSSPRFSKGSLRPGASDD